jgi:hypothetical protein
LIYQDQLGRELKKSAGQMYAAYPEAVLPAKARPREGAGFLVGKKLDLHICGLGKKNIEGQYAIAHVLVDLINYLNIARDLGVIHHPQAVLQTEVILTGACTLGYYPRVWLLEKMTQLEQVGRIFVERYADQLHERDGYQVRALEFCIERIGSYFLDQLQLPESSYGVQLYFDHNYGTGTKGGTIV